jgi:virulence-associated protein VapD
MEQPKTVRVGNITVTQISPKEREILAQKIKKRHDRLRNRYREIHKKVVDWVSHSVEQGSVYVCIRFMDKTEFSLQFTPQILTDSIDLSDMSTGDFKMIREYYRRRDE